ncbi:uncharacterized protein [Choristoneura fumiferana]|uniref:uncharacterized protein n=1 Tax=Choristoneura fumiferana TaxID=7141 RepID=UPI003D15DB1A
MHNWRFLLLAFVAVIQPIASYIERGLVDGRQQRCDYRTASVLRDPGLHFHGTHRFSKPAVEDRRLNQRADIREIHRNEVKKESSGTLERGESTLTRLGRASQTESRFARDGVVLRQEYRWSQFGDSRKERDQEFRGERPTNIYANHRARLDSHLSSNRLTEDDSRSQFRINDRLSMDRQRDTRANRDNTQTHRSQETREIRVSDWERNDITSSSRIARRIARDNAQRMDTKRSESRLQVNRNANHGTLDQRFMNREITSSSVSNIRVNRAYNNDELRMGRATHATQSLDRDERRNTQFRQSVVEHTQQRDIHRGRVANNRDSVSADQRNIRQATARGKTANLRSSDHRTSESRREVNRRDFSSLGRDQSVERRLESRRAGRDTRRAKEIRLVENRVSQNARRDSRILECERSVENRRDVRDTRGMERNLQSLERVAETRRDARSADRDRVSNNRQEFRNIYRESRTIMTNPAGINRDRDFERSIETRCTSHKNNKDSCTINKERSTNREMANRDYESVAMARALSADRFAENRRNTRNFVRDYRITGLERATDNQRDTRNVAREAQLERNRIAEINTRTIFKDIGSIENEQSQLNRRDNRNTQHRIARVEYNNRRDARNVQERARSVERAITHQRNTRENEKDVRNIRLNRFSEAQNSRNTHGESRGRAALFKSQRERQHGTIGEDCINAHQRAIRNVETNVRLVRAEKLLESRNDIRKVDRDSRMFRSERLGENRRERSSENRREIRNAEKDTRTARTEEMRRVETRIINTARSRDVSKERRNHRMTEHLNMRNTQLDRRSRSVQQESRAESRHTFERNNEQLERGKVESPTRKREFLSMTRNPSQYENEASIMNWQYIFYTLQGLYICGILTQLMNENSAVKKTRAFSWWSAPQQPIKVD